MDLGLARDRRVFARAVSAGGPLAVGCPCARARALDGGRDALELRRPAQRAADEYSQAVPGLPQNLARAARDRAYRRDVARVPGALWRRRSVPVRLVQPGRRFLRARGD